MKIQLASDLHLEHLERRFPREGMVLPHPLADVLVLAGDIHLGTRGVEYYADAAIPVIYVAGNHEFYGAHWERTRADLKAAAAGTSVHVLDNDRVEIAGVRFLGATLWTDFKQPGFTQSGAMQRVEAALNDFRLIQTDEVPAPGRPRDTKGKDVASDCRQLRNAHAPGWTREVARAKRGRKFTFGAAEFSALRQRLGFTQAQMARLVGASALSIYKWESGQVTPRAAQLEKIMSVRKIGKREAVARLQAE